MANLLRAPWMPLIPPMEPLADNAAEDVDAAVAVTARPEEEEVVAPARIRRAMVPRSRRMERFEEWKKGEASATFIMVRENMSEIVVANNAMKDDM